ncbi:MAG: Crp/Fnr family transcriptional regulator [Betaproteobacteria bacterium]|nr:MAG: Crp/Fnr family transcriptional regulator [Betaproteobacteria bacterium]
MPQGSAVTVDALRSMPIFESLSVERLVPIARVAVFRKVPRGATILRAGDRTDFVYFILSGTLKVLVSDEEGREVILSILNPGEFFGEMGVLDDNPRSATVATTSPCEFVVISKADFKLCLAENFDVSLFIMRNLVKRLRTADRNIESLALMDVYGRVARLLLELAEKDEEGRQVVKRKISKQDIAKMVGASREMVSRVMKDLHLQGLIEEGDGRILLREKLRTI